MVLDKITPNVTLLAIHCQADAILGLRIDGQLFGMNRLTEFTDYFWNHGDEKNTMKKKNLYDDAHLFVAAIRILEYRNAAPPTLDEICGLLSYSAEKGAMVCRRLKDMGIVEAVEGAFGDRYLIQDHTKLEEIPKADETPKFSDELKKFQQERSQISQKVASFKAEQDKKQKDLFAELQKKLKKDLEKK